MPLFSCACCRLPSHACVCLGTEASPLSNHLHGPECVLHTKLTLTESTAFQGGEAPATVPPPQGTENPLVALRTCWDMCSHLPPFHLPCTLSSGSCAPFPRCSPLPRCSPHPEQLASSASHIRCTSSPKHPASSLGQTASTWAGAVWLGHSSCGWAER